MVVEVFDGVFFALVADMKRIFLEVGHATKRARFAPSLPSATLSRDARGQLSTEASTAGRRAHEDLATRRVVVGAAAGMVVAVLVLLAGASWSVAALGFSDVASLVFLTWVWASIVRLDAEATAAVARAEDASPPAAELVLLAALAASLIAVVFTFAQAGRAQAPQRGWLAALAITSIALGWAAVHTVYVLRYARLYYSPPQGGIDFHGEAPAYLDFAYLAVTIGMTFQVSDTDLMGKRVRRVALRHALLSYIFGTVIVATTVSSAAALLGA